MTSIAPPVITLESVSIGFDGVPLFDNLNLTVRRGRTTVIAGRSGSGKSVLLRLMIGLMRPDLGRVTLFGQETHALGELGLGRLRRRMGMVFQNYALLDSITVADNVGFWLRENTKISERKRNYRVAELLARFELDDAADKIPAELSGGMRKRVSLARALSSEPEVLLVDEPTTGLDPIMTERVTEMLLNVQRDFKTTLVVVSHDMLSATRLADELAVLADGGVVACGPPREVAENDHPVVRSFFDTPERREALRATEETSPEARDEPVVELSEVHRRFGSHEVLRGVNLKVFPKQITVIIGGSGSGKSVIVKHIVGLLKPDRGEIRLFGENIANMGERKLVPFRARIGMLFQSAALLDSLTVAENVAFPLVARMGLSPREATARVLDVLEKVRIPEIADRFPAEISNGERKRVGLARALVIEPEVIIYDEPTTGQDPVMTRMVDDMIVETNEVFDVTSIVISHDMPSAFRIGNEIAMLAEGRIIAHGPPEALAATSDERVREFIYAGKDSTRP